MICVLIKIIKKELTFTPRQYELEGGSIKIILKKYLEGQKQLGIKI